MNSFIQISDCHIDDNPIVMGVNSQSNFKKIVSKILKKQFKALLISGDLTHLGSSNSYQILKEMLEPIKAKILVITGNHDNKINLKKNFKENLLTKFKLDCWEIITINSVLKNETAGFLTEKELKKLDNALLQTKAKYIIIALHHPIVSMESNWNDELSLKNPKELFAIIDKYPKVKAILWGHAHQAKEFRHNDIKLISCPSTALQFNEEKRIGFNHYFLGKNGELTYKTCWINNHL